MPKTDDYPLHEFSISNTGIGVRNHDPEHRVNAAVPKGQVGISLDTGFEYEDGVGVYATDKSRVVLLTGPKAKLIKELESVLNTLKATS